MQVLPSRQDLGEGLALLLLPQPYGPPGVTCPIKGCCQGVRDGDEQLQCFGGKAGLTAPKETNASLLKSCRRNRRIKSAVLTGK